VRLRPVRTRLATAALLTALTGAASSCEWLFANTLLPDDAGSSDASSPRDGQSDAGSVESSLADQRGDAGSDAPDGARGDASLDDVVNDAPFDNVVNGCPDAGVLASDTGSSELFIFVTSQLYNGNLGGLAGADCQCQSLAYVAGLPGIYKAWLSDSKASASSRLAHGSVPYKLVDGTIVANNWAGLTSGTLLHAISKTETDGAPPVSSHPCGNAGPATWSDTWPDGGDFTLTSLACVDWTDSTGTMANFGSPLATDNAWAAWCSASGAGVCASQSALYCVEQ
jgi:hypothetical protein